jgi:hypothetical protein
MSAAVLFNGNVENCGAAYLSELLPNVQIPFPLVTTFFGGFTVA